ncbi:hypothetical protein L6Q21_01625 [Sandaracinobacter sp. RS1-74]|uniref:hypothetical protein n=1 Tax=Sandaracinobacteroides sayramensis TaxID=2913411 RepID=UPI001EDA3B94|nr:hypothetical protein [Sandaracinobacteroides sayramensis]MCG2839679.1 hypothetical protein [Sandaracinobacteroides sayramensis]
MRRWVVVASALLLTGCVTVRAGDSADRELALLMSAAADAVRALVLSAEQGGEPDFEGARIAVEHARVAAVLRATEPGSLEQMAGYAALGVTLTLCRDNLDRLEMRLGTESSGQLLARLRVGCIAPLALVAVG